jgi:hypothetical protein
MNWEVQKIIIIKPITMPKGNAWNENFKTKILSTGFSAINGTDGQILKSIIKIK